ncbi:MAG: YdcH family protein [Dongiaceae bacterium]
MSDREQIEALRSKHAELEAQISEEEKRPAPDDARIHELKREKLKIKDELAHHYV